MTKRIVVLTFEGLATSALGAYGCSWQETPGIDRLAAKGVVFDRFYACSTDPLVVLQQNLTIEGSPTSVAKLAGLLGMASLFVTDTPAATKLPAVQDFDHCTLVEPEEIALPANEVEETSLGRLFAAALALQDSVGSSPHLLWIHSSALVRTWDAPLDLRDSDDLMYGREEDVQDDNEPLEESLRQALYAVAPPDRDLTDADDPDMLIAWMAAYGGQVRLIDTLVNVAFASVGEQLGDHLIVGSTGGFTLGEHGRLGTKTHPPMSSRLHLPLIMVSHDCGPLRCGHPVLSNRLSTTLADLIRDASIPSSDSLLEELTPHRWAEVQDSTEPIFEIVDDLPRPSGALTTYRIAPGWFYISNPDGHEELYLKPDDRYDINDVAKLSPDVIEQFRAWQ